MSNENDDEFTNITDPRDSDVLCGRGGAALRHPGNQTYRRLVNLNKSLYITCLKTEKLKISRSIVAAIREQDGRFLEKNMKTGTWQDIGDKKAIEKTSQALREGQPKLRQKMVEEGFIRQEGNPPPPSLEQRFSNGMYNPRSNPTQGVLNGMYGVPEPSQMQRFGSAAEMPPPPMRALSNEQMNPDALMHKLNATNSIPSWTPSLASAGASSTGSSRNLSINPPPPNATTESSWNPRQPDSIPSWTPSVTSQMSQMSEINRSMRRLRPSNGGSFGGGGNDMNMMGFGNYHPEISTNSSSTFGMEIDLGRSSMHNHKANNSNNPNMAPPPPPPPPAMSPMMMGSPLDRRRTFAKMKYNRQNSSRSIEEDMALIESNMSLMSTFSKDDLTLSNHGVGSGGLGSGGLGSSVFGGTSSNKLSPFSDHSNHGLGSRRSIMSGISGIGDVSSVFSDLAKKPIPKDSTRSMALSDFSGIEEDDYEDYDGFAFDSKSED